MMYRTDAMTFKEAQAMLLKWRGVEDDDQEEVAVCVVVRVIDALLCSGTGVSKRGAWGDHKSAEILRLHDQGLSGAQIAKAVGLSKSFTNKVIARREASE